MKTYEKQQNWLNDLFGFLPQYMFWLIAGMRLIVGVPIFMSGRLHMEFTGSAIGLVMSLIAVITLELLGITATITTAYFRQQKITEGFWFMLVIAVIVAGFNAYLLENSDLGMSNVAKVVFHFFNVLSLALGEAIGWLVVSVNKEAKRPEKMEINRLILNSKTSEAFTLTPQLTPKKAYELKQSGMLQKDIAKKYNSYPVAVGRLIKAHEDFLNEDK